MQLQRDGRGCVVEHVTHLFSFCGQTPCQHRNHWPKRRKQTGGQHVQTTPRRISMKHAMCMHFVQHLRVLVGCERLRVPCAACHVPHVVYTSEAASPNVAPSQPMVMQRRCHVGKFLCVCATELPRNCVRGCLCFRRPLRSHCWLGDGAQAGTTRVTWQIYES